MVERSIEVANTNEKIQVSYGRIAWVDALRKCKYKIVRVISRKTGTCSNEKEG